MRDGAVAAENRLSHELAYVCCRGDAEAYYIKFPAKTTGIGYALAL